MGRKGREWAVRRERGEESLFSVPRTSHPTADFKPVRKKKHDNRRQSRRPALQESAASVPPKGVSLSAFAHSAIEKGGGEADSEVRSSEVRSSSSRKSRKQTMKRKVG